MWKTQTFQAAFDDPGSALLCGQTGFYPVSQLSQIIIKRKEDLMLADFILNSAHKKREFDLQYDILADEA